ncbi:MAG: FAD:protein FMN transferase [Nocardioides sp.]|nr:FAD:protein FMN transferase [Nocardioidaceae bacterium]MCB8957513.1 FAD:protein FMN transferase [Nocardioides sp.]
MTATPTSATFDALGTYVFVATRDPRDLPVARRLAELVLDDVDRTCSRFRPDSDLSRANAEAGQWVEVDPLLVTAVSAACQAADQTDGLVDPLLGRTLVQLGYDRDLAELVEVAEDEQAPVVLWPADVPGPDRWREIGLDPDGAILVPTGTALDLGSTGKAWAADVVAAAFAAELSASALVSIGGDLAVAAADGEPWPIAISTHPGAPAETIVGLDRGGLATSSTRVRRWARRGVRLHHLVDPRTGWPAPEVWRTVTATGATCAAANTATTAAVVLGDAAPAWLAERGVAARLVTADGRVRTTGGWPEERGAA